MGVHDEQSVHCDGERLGGFVTTFGQIVDEVLLGLEGFSGDQDVFGTLVAPLDATQSTFGVAGPGFPDGSGFTPGIVEVGDELVYAQALERPTGVFSGCLRGWRGTTASDWPGGTLVRDNPKYPRIAVRRAVDATLTNLYPRLGAVRTTTVRITGSQVRYATPTDCRNVAAVHYSTPGVASWQPCEQWTFDPLGSAVEIMDGIAGRDARLTYLASPSAIADLGDEFDSCGLDESVRDVVVLGAQWRLAANADAGRVVMQSANQQLLNQQNPVGAGVSLAKHYLGLFNARLEEAAVRQRESLPARRHWVA